jgi:choline dehydrogenase-like flavoprotein
MAHVAVVGLGPAGIIAARVLADAGVTVTAFQPGSAAGGAGARSPLASPAPTLRSHPDEVAVPQPHPPAGRDGLGGSKLLAAPQAYRMDPWSLRMRSLARRRPDVPTADVDLVDWPISLDDLAPWYDGVERLTGVGPRPATAWTERMRGAAERLGWHPFAAPAAEVGDLSVVLPPEGLTIVPATVTALRRDGGGEVSGLDYRTDDGEAGALDCDAVVVAASVIPTVRLLLLSGLSADGRVGRWFLAHNTFVVHGDFGDADLGRRHAGPASAVATSAFEGAACAGADVIGGSVLQAAMTGPWDEQRMRATARGMDAASVPASDPLTWVSAHHRSIGSVWGQPDQLPHEENRVDLDPDHTDAAGIPVARVTFALHDDDHRRSGFLAARAADWLEAAGARRTWTDALQAQPLGTHLYGGARMGTDPATSVVDSHGRFHGVAGLVVMGSATFPSTGGRGPVETIEALAWRSAAQLVDDLR